MVSYILPITEGRSGLEKVKEEGRVSLDEESFVSSRFPMKAGKGIVPRKRSWD